MKINEHVLLACLKSVQIDTQKIQTTDKIDEAKIAAARIDGVVKQIMAVLQHNGEQQHNIMEVR